MTKGITFKDLRLEGAAKWVHRFVMFVTYPFRHFFVFLILVLIVLAVGVAIPLFNGVSFENIAGWYGQKLGVVVPIKNPEIKTAPKKIKPLTFKKEIKLKHADFEPKPANPENVEKKAAQEADTGEKYAAWKIKNKNVSQSGEIKAAPVAEKAKETPVVSEPEKEIKIKTKPSENTIAPSPKADLPVVQFTKRDDLDLVYYETPKHISGEAIIYGANEISVDDTYLYLYGIYTNPDIHNEALARSYLRELLAKQTTDCYVVAETKDGIGTAICFAAGKNINQSLVKAYLADDIAL